MFFVQSRVPSNCLESMGEHLRGGPSLVTSNKPEQLLPSTALTARTMSCLTSTPCQPARPLSTMMSDHQTLGHGVLAKAAISRTPPELNGLKWHGLQKFVSGTMPLATKNQRKMARFVQKLAKTRFSLGK